MLYSLNGRVTHIGSNYIAIDVNGICYQVYVPNTNIYFINTNAFIYVLQIFKEFEQYLVGFKDRETKKIFMLLLKIKGFGPKTALRILKDVNPYDFINAIKNNDVSYLESKKSIGHKNAITILSNLKGTIPTIKIAVEEYESVFQALLELGYKRNDIDTVLTQINKKDKNTEAILKLALIKLKSV